MHKSTSLKITLTFVVAGAAFFPILAFAQLVPCQGVVGEVGGALSLGCTVCDLAKLINNVVNWMVNIAFPLGALYAIYGGYLYITAGISPKQAAEGKQAVLASAIGIAIVLSSWAVVNTTLKFLTGSESWYNIDCRVGAAPAAPGEGVRAATPEEIRAIYNQEENKGLLPKSGIEQDTSKYSKGDPTDAEIQDALSHLPKNATPKQIDDYIQAKRAAR